MKLDDKDKEILMLLQKNSKMPAREIAKQVNAPITTVFAKIKRMEDEGLIRGYTAILNAEKLGKPITAFIFASFSNTKNISQRDLVKEISMLPGVQEAFIVTGEWDILLKIKEADMASLGKFVVDSLRNQKGIEKVLTVMVLENNKETLEVNV